jgi:hypothetical protein
LTAASQAWQGVLAALRLTSNTIIMGNNFTAAASVTIGSSRVITFHVNDDGTISVKVPPGIASVADIVVLKPAGNSGAAAGCLTGNAFARTVSA